MSKQERQPEPAEKTLAPKAPKKAPKKASKKASKKKKHPKRQQLKKSGRKTADAAGPTFQPGGRSNQQLEDGGGSGPTRSSRPRKGVRQINREKHESVNKWPSKAGRLSLEGLEEVRLITHVSLSPDENIPTQVNEGETEKLSGIQAIAEGVPQREQQLEEIDPRTVGTETESIMKAALWWAAGVRQPRAAIVGRALHELGAISEADAGKATADKICLRIQDRGRQHLRPVILRALESSKEPTKTSSALAGHLHKALAVLEELNHVRAAPRAGNYLVGQALKIFHEWPEWDELDEELPKKLTRSRT